MQGLMGNRTMPSVEDYQTITITSGSSPTLVWAGLYHTDPTQDTPTPCAVVNYVVGSTQRRALVVGNNSLLPTDTAQYVRFAYSRAIDYATTPNTAPNRYTMFLALRNDGKLDGMVLEPTVRTFTNYIPLPRPDLEAANYVGSPPTGSDLEEYKFFVVVYQTSNPYRYSGWSLPVSIKLRPTEGWGIRLRFTASFLTSLGTLGNFTCRVFCIKNGAVYWIGDTDMTNVNTTTRELGVVVPPAEVLPAGAVDFVFYRNPEKVFNKTIRGLTATPDRFIYWTETQIFISNLYSPFEIGVEEGFDVSDGVGGVVDVPNVVDVVPMSNYFLVFTPYKVYRLAEFGTGVWGVQPTELPPPAKPPNNTSTRFVIRSNLYYSVAGWVYIGENEEVQILGDQFDLLRVKTIDGTPAYAVMVGETAENDSNLWVWVGGENAGVYQFPSGQSYDWVQHVAQQMYLFRAQVSSGNVQLRVFRWNPNKWVSDTSQPLKPIRWVYRTAFPYEVYIHRVGVFVGEINTLTTTKQPKLILTITNLDKNSQTKYLKNLEVGWNTVWLPCKLRGSTFEFDFLIGEFTADSTPSGRCSENVSNPSFPSNPQVDYRVGAFIDFQVKELTKGGVGR
jgi:hypothetical protein